MKTMWDSRKNAANRRKHGVSFEEASALFESDEHWVLFDEGHSEEEECFISIGLIQRGVVVVVWTQSSALEVRIISARLATTGERTLFEQPMRGK